ncbi:hypothetical protein cypCar_00013871 [Cyprinus carpio]|nr:hypothetical protein cypCar_00013871 [Cyprinus carpio]
MSDVPKTYSLNTNAQTDSSSVSDKSILKVVIQPELEKKVIKLINDYRQEHADKGPISGRLTSKKLLDLYTALQMFRFKTEHIEEAMKSSMLYGGDLHSALDWLCLNLRDDELPEGFSQKMQEEKQKTRPKFQAPKEDEKQTVAKKEASKEDEKPKAKTCVKDSGGSMKEWILRYAEQSEDQSSEDDEIKDSSVINPELEEKFDPNDRYLLLSAQLYDAKEMAAESKAKKDKAGQRTAQDRIRVIQQEMKSLESHPMFNSAIKVKDTPKEEKKPVTLTDGKEDLNFNIFEQADTPPAEKTEKQENEPKDIRNFDYTSRSWTGKSPKQFLIDWCRKNLPKSPPPSFQKVAVGRYWKCRVRIQRPNDVLEVCPTILTEDGMQAQHLGATLALFNLVKGQSVHQLLPLTYREVWLEWRDSEQKEEEQTRSAINKPRDQFIAHLLTRLKQQQTLQPQAEQQGLQDAELEDSWENLDMQEDHEPQCKGGFMAEEMSRRLFLKLRSSALARRLLVEREQLPVFQQRQMVLEALRCHRVLVIAGETGSGKSTQIPQLILEELLANGEAAQPCNVVVTQPRRISAMSLASRVSQELGCEDGPGAKVFHLEDIVEETGYVLEKDSEYSQKFVEEEEEVSINITQKGGKTFQHQELIMRDSGSGLDLGPELDHFSKRTRHVLQYMNPNKINMDLILDILEYLGNIRHILYYKSPQFRDVDGAVLIFLPGLAHIQQLYDLVTTDKRFSSKDRYKLVALHSTLSSQDQSSAFTVPPPGVRKIVLSTNIAETGVTIPDVVFVIDTGKTKENRYHESSQMSSLVETFKCEYGSPEDFLCQALDAPQQQAVCNAVSLLRKIGACQQDSYTLTPLGHHLAALPVNVKIGKMLIFGAIFGCLEPIATIAAAMSEKSPFVTPMNRKEEANLAKSALAVANSDHMTIYNAYLRWKSSRSEGTRAEMAFCQRHFLSRNALLTIEDVKRELIRMVEQAGFTASKPSRTPRSRPGAEPKALGSLSQQDVSVLKAVLTAGLYDSVGRILCTPSLDVQEQVVCVAETAQGKAHVHPSSVNRFLQTHGWLLFQEKVKYTKVFLRDTTLISPLSMLLFGGDIDVQHRERLISLDGWICFQAPVRIGVIFKHLRKLIDSLLERKLANPKMNLEDEKTIQIITELIKSENML